uniref:EF-hand domain-containing protein n=1 Tax=Macrostomum lignano TaxID=282301 RepID=A0A1I8JQR4_9PLAT
SLPLILLHLLLAAIAGLISNQTESVTRECREAKAETGLEGQSKQETPMKFWVASRHVAESAWTPVTLAGACVLGAPRRLSERIDQGRAGDGPAIHHGRNAAVFRQRSLRPQNGGAASLEEQQRQQHPEFAYPNCTRTALLLRKAAAILVLMHPLLSDLQNGDNYFSPHQMKVLKPESSSTPNSKAFPKQKTFRVPEGSSEYFSPRDKFRVFLILAFSLHSPFYAPQSRVDSGRRAHAVNKRLCTVVTGWAQQPAVSRAEPGGQAEPIERREARTGSGGSGSGAMGGIAETNGNSGQPSDRDAACEMGAANRAFPPFNFGLFAAALKEAFNFFDIDHDGRITAGELHKVLKFLGTKVTENEVKMMIADVDSDENTNRKDMLTGHTEDADMWEAFKTCRDQEDYALPRRRGLRTRTSSPCINEADADNDGRITLLR